MFGELKVTGISPKTRRIAKVEVTFEVDPDGILNVSAVDRSAGRQNRVTVINNIGSRISVFPRFFIFSDFSGRFSESEIELMMKDAELRRREDEKQRQRMSAQNSL